MNIQQIIDALRDEHSKAAVTAANYAEALALLERIVAVVSGECPDRKQAPAKVTKPSPKKTIAKAKPSKPTADDEPRTVRGKMPTAGVQQVLCNDLKERQRRLGILKENGYSRVGPGEPLTAGTYDVRSTGDGDDSAVVLWRMRLDEAAA